MLPEIKLKDVSRDDVDRIAWWLEDTELSSKWFGHYGCGDPVHRGYDPQHMLEAPQSEWQRVFGDSSRLIYSVYSENDAHIGESQLILDGEGGAELALLIGRKNLWHRGYGTATAITLMEKVFAELGLRRVWVSIPEDNTAAMGLFEKLGFVRKAARQLCTRPDGSALDASVLDIEASVYLARRTSEGRKPGFAPVIVITGMPGSGSEEVGREIARIVGGRFVDEEIPEMLAQRLRCTPNEIDGFESGFRSFWTRMLAAIAMPTEWSAAYDAGYQWHAGKPVPGSPDFLEDKITRRQYVQALSGIVRGFAVQGNVVLNNPASRLFVPSKPGTITVFVSESTESRAQRVSAQEGLTLEDAMRWVKQADSDLLSHCKYLLNTDALDMAQYDLTVNLDRLPVRAAAQMVAGSLHVAAPSVGEAVEAPSTGITATT